MCSVHSILKNKNKEICEIFQLQYEPILFRQRALIENELQERDNINTQFLIAIVKICRQPKLYLKVEQVWSFQTNPAAN